MNPQPYPLPVVKIRDLFTFDIPPAYQSGQNVSSYVQDDTGHFFVETTSLVLIANGAVVFQRKSTISRLYEVIAPRNASIVIFSPQAVVYSSRLLTPNVVAPLNSAGNASPLALSTCAVSFASVAGYAWPLVDAQLFWATTSWPTNVYSTNQFGLSAQPNYVGKQIIGGVMPAQSILSGKPVSIFPYGGAATNLVPRLDSWIGLDMPDNSPQNYVIDFAFGSNSADSTFNGLPVYIIVAQGKASEVFMPRADPAIANPYAMTYNFSTNPNPISGASLILAMYPRATAAPEGLRGTARFYPNGWPPLSPFSRTLAMPLGTAIGYPNGSSVAQAYTSWLQLRSAV